MRKILIAVAASSPALAAGCTQQQPSAPGTARATNRGDVNGSNDQIALQPMSVEGSVGLNAAAGVAALSLRKVS